VILGLQTDAKNIEGILISLIAIPQSMKPSKKDLHSLNSFRMLSPARPSLAKLNSLSYQAKEPQGYSLVIGEHGTGKTSLIQLTVNGLKKPSGIVYVMIPNTDDVSMNPTIVIDAVRDALGWNPDPVLDSGNSKRSSPIQYYLKLTDQLQQLYSRCFGSSPVSL
jgi:hypothetical protein